MTHHRHDPRPPLPTLFRHPPRPAPQQGDPDDVSYVLDITVVDALGKELPGAEVSIINNNNGVPSSRYSDGMGFTNHALLGRPDDLVTIQTNGFKVVAATGQPTIGPQYFYLPTGDHVTLQLSLDSFKQGFRPVPALPRSPLPPFAEPINYRTTLAWTPPPPNPTRDFLRGDFWGVEMPGAPQVPGVGRKYERIFSWFLPKYPLDFQQAYLTKYGGYGYTHFLLSYADSTGPTENPGKTPGAGQTLEQFLETCALVKRYVPYLHVRFGSKDFQPAHMSPQQWADFVDPVFAQLVAAKLVDEVSLGWELNLWNTPGQPLIDALRHLGRQAHAAGLTSWQHFSPHYTSWFADGDERGRFGWYDDLANDVDGLNYQTQGPQWSAQMLQARMVDTLWQFGERGNDYKFRMEEDFAFWMWDTDEVSVQVDDAVDANGNPVLTTVRVTPEEANQRGYLACCTIDDVKHTSAKVWGYGNGGRMPDGSRL